MADFFDMDGTLAVYERWVYEPMPHAPWYERIRGTHYYRSCKPHPKMLAYAADRIRQDPGSAYILTSVEVPMDLYYEQVADKIAWIQQYLPELLPDHFLVTASRHPIRSLTSKSRTAREALGRPLTRADRLYDDFNPNLEDWREAGGTPVKVLNGLNHARPDMESLPIR